jgi:DnaJ-class molecular chaperone
MNKYEAIILDRNRELNARMRDLQEAGRACQTCGGDGLKQNGSNWIKCDDCGGSGLNASTS